MNPKTVNYTAENGLCCGCGICRGICPRGCISWRKENGLYLPLIDETQCINCGICAAVCPGLGHAFAPADTAADSVTGTVLDCHNAWSRNPALRHTGASGGVISTMVQQLLSAGLYDGAFCLDSYDYREQLRTRLYKEDWDWSNVPKSRYLPVSHENALQHIKDNRDQKLILIGTSCAIRGLQAAIQKLNIPREQYLFVGLFCDQVFNYNVLAYFRDTYASGSEIEALHFKNKESGGWPGDMKFYPENGVPFYVPLSERAKAKSYFMPERCLYCVDKLNVRADISLGDNYTGKDESSLGSNSVIIRTQAGQTAWDAVKHLLEIRDIEIQDIQKAQYLEGRLHNLYYADIKVKYLPKEMDLNTGVCREQDYQLFVSSWKDKVKRLSTGAVYAEDPGKIRKQIRKDEKKPNGIVQFLKRAFRYLKRKLK